MLDSIAIGERIKRLRNLQGYSREEFSEMINVSPRFVYDLELGNKGMSVDTLTRVSKSLNITIDYLLFGETTEYSPSQLEVLALIDRCPKDKEEYLNEIIKNYITAVNK